MRLPLRTRRAQLPPLEGRVGKIEARALGVLQQIPERPCYIATRTGLQTAINGHGAADLLHATARNLGGRVRRRR